MAERRIEVSDDEIRALIRERGPITGWSGWGPRPKLDWEDARRELIALKKNAMPARTTSTRSLWDFD